MQTAQWNDPVDGGVAGRQWYLSLVPTFGVQIILLYALCTYILPIACSSVIDMPLGLYRSAAPNSAGVILLLASFAAFILLSALHQKDCCVSNGNGRPFSFSFLSSNVQLLVLLLLAGLSLVVYLRGMNDWRYESESLSDVGSPLLLLYALSSVALKFFLFVYVFFDRDVLRNWEPSRALRKILLCAGLVLTANGTATMLYAALGILLVIAPQSLSTMLYKRTTCDLPRSGFNAGSRFRLVLSACVGVAGIALSWVLGEGIKRGDISSVIDTVSNPEFAFLIAQWFVGRISSSYYSLLIALDHYALATDVDVIVNHLFAPLKSFAYRLDHLLLQPFSMERPDAGSLMRINYLNLAEDPFDVRQGTSPGLLASFLIVLPLPMNYMVLTAYLFLLQRFITRVGHGLVGELTLVGKMLCWPFLLTLFESPIDFLLVVDDGFFALLLLIWLQYRITPKNQG